MKQKLADRYKAAAGLASSIVTFAQTQGIDAVPIARTCGLDPSRFDSIGERVSIDKVCRFMEALALIAGDELFGLKASAHFERGASGPFGYAMMNAANPRKLMEFLARNLKKVSESCSCNLEFGSYGAHFEWTHSHLILHRDQFVDMGTGQTFQHFRAHLGNDAQLIKLCLERPRPRDTKLHKHMLTNDIRFGASINSMTIPARLLERQNPHADERLFTLMVQQLEAMPAPKEATDPVSSIRLQVAENLGSKTITLSSEAQRLGMSERTLQRRLTDAGTSMNAIIDEARKELAESLLADTDLQLSEISSRLGFSAPSVFTRSAIRWFDRPPSDYRRQQNPES